jgi:methionine aminopeptidase
MGALAFFACLIDSIVCGITPSSAATTKITIGDVMMVGVSAHTGEGIDALLDAITLTAEILEFSAVTKGPAQGRVLEARLDFLAKARSVFLFQFSTWVLLSNM